MPRGYPGSRITNERKRLTMQLSSRASSMALRDLRRLLPGVYEELYESYTARLQYQAQFQDARVYMDLSQEEKDAGDERLRAALAIPSEEYYFTDEELGSAFGSSEAIAAGNRRPRRSRVVLESAPVLGESQAASDPLRNRRVARAAAKRLREDEGSRRARRETDERIAAAVARSRSAGLDEEASVPPGRRRGGGTPVPF